MSSPVELSYAKAEEFQKARLGDRIKLYQENKEFRELYVGLLPPGLGVFALRSSLCTFFLEMHDPLERTCCADKGSTKQPCIGSASQAEVFNHATLPQKCGLINELKDSPQVVKLIMYLPEIQQAQVFAQLFQDWERGDLMLRDHAGTEKLLRTCAKVQEEQGWHLNGIPCVATNSFPKTRTCSVCKEEFIAGRCGIRALCSSHAAHARCFRTGDECPLCKGNN